ncbi:hypothetical protein E8E13_001108 [Curvularia kusanoi]|uniref:Uncharacterized protein n=1 Tax=Curvularia kusanoi TaxID=90978 RepID=A0A9P4TKN3_CURKU|nr:hypothetical protein E8E13_001108 [Curvularia kusanoi]
MNLDGACESKPAHEPHQKQTLAEYKPTKLRRFMSIGSRRSRTFRSNSIHTNPGSTPPLQTLSPRPTGFDPDIKKHKRSVSAFLLSRPSARESVPPKRESDACTTQDHLPVTETSSVSFPPAANKDMNDSRKDSGHLPLTGDPYHSVQMQPRKDSAIKAFHEMPPAASRNAALRSHPVESRDLEVGDQFHTPEEFWGRQKAGPLRKGGQMSGGAGMIKIDK